MDLPVGMAIRAAAAIRADNPTPAAAATLVDTPIPAAVADITAAGVGATTVEGVITVGAVITGDTATMAVAASA